MTSLPAECPLWVMGDVHGAFDKLRTLLLSAGLIDVRGDWTGGRAHLVFLGDYMDRGPNGIGVVRLVRRLEAQAPASGGRVSALLGNHEVMFLAAQRFARSDPGDRYGFFDYWLANGGQGRDAANMTAEEEGWLAARPALLRVGRWLLLHADSPMYLHLGTSVNAVNAAVARLMQSVQPEVWGHFANAFAERLAFADHGGEKVARKLLNTFGGTRLAHGHTPVPILLGESGLAPEDGPGLPVLYASQLCVALDSGLTFGDAAGFLTRLDDRGVAEVVPYPAPERRTRF
ncbi:metallophosphoesterase [Deinococcus hopiensis]|uniref:Calcineurin-like phosphoesterase n=1 Tax=Deinococcus hopiensis KR-140 TaxID=695939 RepID=A0A1W1VBG9_9DEIO|nr:metallophosphoesterase [Deinococcus hopiensis]SMB90665.1 Calcineurin-like phosphoesterase [Deinococcus hopiensis KR-140]